jgi:serine/threonine protein phosphatase PrpC
VRVTGPIPGLCDAVVQLYDGHGGKHAARFCMVNMVPVIEDAFFSHSSTQPLETRREELAFQVGPDGFHPLLDDSLVSAFERLDEAVKRSDPSGTTATVLLLKRGVGDHEGAVHVKCAWVGDSRAVICRDFDPAQVVDLSVDHKPECPSEVARIQQLYESLHGVKSFKTREEAHTDVSVRGGVRNPGPGGSPRMDARKDGKIFGDGMPAVEMTLGHAEAMEQVAWQTMENGALAGRAPAPLEKFRGEGNEENEVDEEKENAGARIDAGERASRERGGTRVSSDKPRRLEQAAEEGEQIDADADAWAKAEKEKEGEAVALVEVKVEANADVNMKAETGMETIRLPPSREASGEVSHVSLRSPEASDAAALAQNSAAELAARLRDDGGDGFDSDDEEDVPVDERLQATLDRVNSQGAAAQRMSFVGYFKSDDGKAISKPRMFSSSGESHGMSRSIGDRGSARAVVATPDVKTVTVRANDAARIVVCSDGVWDCYSSNRAVRAIRRFQTAEGAAKRMCVFAREKREYTGIAMDDISAVVVDVGENLTGGEPGCKGCVVS